MKNELQNGNILYNFYTISGISRQPDYLINFMDFYKHIIILNFMLTAWDRNNKTGMFWNAQKTPEFVTNFCQQVHLSIFSLIGQVSL